MKVNKKILAIAALMALGVAGADPQTPSANTTNTPAGQPIDNKATASYTDPTGTPGESTSNTVTTKVLPLPGFDITYADGTGDGSGATDPAVDNSAYGNSATVNTPKFTDNVVAGQPISTNYALVNNGNTPIVVHVAPKVTGLGANDVTYAFPAGTTLTNVVYDAAGTKIVSADVLLPQGQVIDFTQTITVPTGLAAGAVIGATPTGVAYNNPANAGNGLPADMQEDQSVENGAVTATPAAGTDMQYTAARLYTPTLTNNPDGSPDHGTTTTVPEDNTPPVSTVPVPVYTPDPTTPGGTTSATPIEVVGNNQNAYPPADGDTANDVVVFTNNVHNSGTLADPVNLFPSDASGNPIGTYDPTTGIFSNIPGLPTGTTVQFLKPDGTPLPTGADGYPTITVQPGGDAPYLTKVTYPDSNSLPNQVKIPVTVGVDSGLDSGTVADDKTYDTVYPPAAQFGDTSALTTGPLAVNPSPTPEKSVTPDTTVTTPTQSPNYDMTVANTGTYPDTYTLAGAVPIKLNDGTTKVYPVNYAGATIDPAFMGDATAPLSTTQTPGTSPVVVNGTTYYAPTYTTPVVAANSSTTGITASVPVPYNAAMTTGVGTGTNPEPTLQQTATGVLSTIKMVDTNDLLKIVPVGKVVVGKFTQASQATAITDAGTQYATNATGTTATVSTTAPAAGTIYVTNPGGYDGRDSSATPAPLTSYLPGVAYNYQIIGKNGLNGDITNFVLSDTLNTALTLNSITCSGSGVSGQTTDATTGKVTATCTYATLTAGSTATMTLNVQIK